MMLKDTQELTPPYNEEEDKGPYVYEVFSIKDKTDKFTLKSDIRIVSSNISIFEQIRVFKKDSFGEYGIFRIDDNSDYDYILENGIIK